MHMTLSSDLEKNVPFINKFAVKVCNLPDFGPSSDSSSWMKLFRKTSFTLMEWYIYRMECRWIGIFSRCNADELDAMQMNCADYLSKQQDGILRTTGHQNMKFKTFSCKKDRPEDVMIQEYFHYLKQISPRYRFGNTWEILLNEHCDSLQLK